MKSPTIHDALAQMRKLSKDNIAFSFSYVKCNTSTQNSSGVKVVSRGLLRTGHSVDKGIKSRSLIAYLDVDTNERRFFYLPLLLTFNQFQIK